MKRKIIAVIAGILILDGHIGLCRIRRYRIRVNITEMRVYQLDRGEYADDFTERVDTDTVRELLTHIRHVVYRVCGLRGYRKAVLSLR